MKFDEELNQRTKEVEKQVLNYLPTDYEYQEIIIKAVEYSMTAGGKRLRPLFVSEVFSLISLGKEDANAAKELLPPFLAAIEMIHTYSLVHDDLPAMDNDMYRRGKLTTHAKYGEAVGILTGDALLNLAFETAFRAFDMIDTQEEKYQIQFHKRVAKALQILGEKSGIYGMIGGQVVDIIKSGQAADMQELLFIYRLKTSALLEASFLVGAVLAGANQEELNGLCKIASEIGIAFQIQDDILDVTSDMAVLGKPTHSDEKNQKTTYVSLYGLEKSKIEVERLSKHAVSIYDNLFAGKYKAEEDFLRYLVLELITRKK